MSQPHFGQLKLVGKISLWFSLVAAMGLMAVIWIAGSVDEDYLGQIHHLAATRKNLPLVMLLGGLLLAIGTGITTWLITLYSTFRVAGPVYRFSSNLKLGVLQGEVPQISIRDTDQLQTENQLLQQSVSLLYQHYAALDQAAEQLLDELDRDYLSSDEDSSSGAAIEQALTHLQRTAQLARYE